MKFALIILIIALIIYVHKLKKDTSNKNIHIYNIINILLMVGLLEVTLFNINSFRLDFGNYIKREYSYINATHYKNGDLEYIEILDINTKVGTLRINMESDKAVRYTVSYVDSLGVGYMGLPSKVFVEGIENSKSVPLFLTGDVKKLQIKLDIPTDTKYKIHSITLNEPIKPYFNLVRFLIISLFIILIYAIKNVNLFSMAYSRKNKVQYLTVVSIVLLYMGLLYWCSSTSIGEGHYTDNLFYTQMYVDALSKGQIYLDEEPPSALIRFRRSV